MAAQKLRWGFLSTAQIARKNWKAVHNSGNSTLAAVASRDLERSRRFVAECQAHTPIEDPPRAFESYEELLASRDVDAVYIPLPTALRKQWVIRAAEAGKHVLCEKPCATSIADLREMLEACHRNRVQFMDGVMFMHSERLAKLRQTLDDGTTVGEVKRITSAFSFRGDDAFFAGNIRANGALEPFGCLGDLGWYCLRMALWTMGERLPTHVTGRILSELQSSSSPAPVPTEFSGELYFENGVSSAFYCSFLNHDEQWAVLAGSRGYVRLFDFVLPFFGDEVGYEVNQAAFNVAACDFNMEAHWRRVAVPEYSNSHPTAQETNMFRNFTRAVQSGILNETWPTIALNTQRVLEACLQSARSCSRETSLPS